MTNKEKVRELREKILKGLDLSFKKLLIQKQKDNEDLVFCRNGKIVKIKASEV